jgi:pimeloyl-ACP methyl ester carboxylesterase
VLVLLHGFPEFWRCWRRQIGPLAEAGFRVVAPDLRGYNLSGRPEGVEAYRVQHRAADVAGLIAHLGGRAPLAGHDWGGVVAWHTAMRHPGSVDRLMILNAPHPAVFSREMRRPRQFLRSWYALFFQLPRLPEWAIRARNFALIDALFREHVVRPGAYTEEDIRACKEALAIPGALTAALNYYRAYLGSLFRRRRGPEPQRRRVEAPTLVIWGEQDRALNLHNLDGLERYVPRLRVERIPYAGHWVMADATEKVNRLMVEFLRGPAPQPAEGAGGVEGW